MANRDDDLKDSFYLYIMRSSIGAGLRSQYAPNGHMPDRLAELMRELDAERPGAEGKNAGEEPIPDRRAGSGKDNAAGRDPGSAR